MYQDGVQVSAYKPKYALNQSFDFAELKVFMGYLTIMCSMFTALNFLVGWEIELFWLGFGIAFLNFKKLGPVFGIKTPEKTLIKARVVLDGNPEQLSKAFTDTHCEFKDYV